MTRKEFIRKWNVAFENKEQELDFAAEMERDLKELSKSKKVSNIFLYVVAMCLIFLYYLIFLN